MIKIEQMFPNASHYKYKSPYFNVIKAFAILFLKEGGNGVKKGHSCVPLVTGLYT